MKLEELAKIISRAWYCYEKGDKNYTRPFRADRELTDTVRVDEEVCCVTAPLVMFIGYADSFGFDKEDIADAAEMGQCWEEAEYEYKRMLSAFNVITKACIGKRNPKHDGLDQWNRKVELINNKIEHLSNLSFIPSHKFL